MFELPYTALPKLTAPKELPRIPRRPLSLSKAHFLLPQEPSMKQYPQTTFLYYVFHCTLDKCQSQKSLPLHQFQSGY